MDNMSINKKRLLDSHNSNEARALKLCKLKSGGSPSIERTLKEYVLKIDTYSEYLNDEQKELIQKLRNNREVVDIVLDTVFQWFGTPCGISEISELNNKLKNNKDKL